MSSDAADLKPSQRIAELKAYLKRKDLDPNDRIQAQRILYDLLLAKDDRARAP